MRLIEESCRIADVMLEGMLRILRPGLSENQVAGWGHLIARELGAEGLGFDVMVTTGRNNKTMVGRPSNTVIREGDIVHIGVSPKRDGLCGAERISVQCVRSPELVSLNTSSGWTSWRGRTGSRWRNLPRSQRRGSRAASTRRP